MTEPAGWIEELGILPPSSGSVTAFDESSVDHIAYLLDTDLRDLMVTVQSLLRLHDRALPTYAMRTGKWSLDLPTAVAKSVITGIVTTTVLQALGADSVPVVVLSLIAPLLFAVKRVEIRASDLVVHASLRQAAPQSEASLRELYERLPAEIAAEMTFLQFADVVDRLSQAGLARDGKRGIRLPSRGARRGFLLTFAEPELSSAAPSASVTTRTATVVICTAIETEYLAVLRHLGKPVSVRRHRGLVFETGNFPGADGNWQIALTQTGQGNVTASIALDRAVMVFEPQIAMFVGVAGGRKDVRLGDVVAAETVYDYESAKDTEIEYLPRIKTQSSSLSLVSEAWATARADRWQGRAKADSIAPRPEAVVKPIASGSRVIADTRSGTAQLLDRYCGDAVAVDKESYGFLQALAANPGIEGLVVRGISDLLTGKDEDSDQYWQPVAASHAAAFAFDLIGRLPHPA
jgi:nucleoside phosphorylase